MISVEKLVKRYGAVKALDGISFEVPRGQVVGFVGPNGAGKSTTLKIVTTYVPATEGRVRIAELDVSEKPLEVRRKIGYLPEHAPLYLDMDVVSYLDYVASVRELGTRPERRRAIARAAELCSVLDVAGRRLSELSKGYRQRVGLAQALLHDPPVLILDEPTSGLDPVQDREVRRVIRSLGKERTIVFSTHILPEVESTCDRAIVIDRGRIVADGKPDDLRAALGSRIRARVSAPRAKVESELRSRLGKSVELGLEAEGEETKVALAAPKDGVDSVMKALAAAGTVLSFSEERPSLEDAFFKLVSPERAER